MCCLELPGGVAGCQAAATGHLHECGKLAWCSLFCWLPWKFGLGSSQRGGKP